MSSSAAIEVSAMTARTRLARRLALVAESIDAGRYPTPAAAADAILEVVLSAHPPHRADLLEALEAAPPIDFDRVMAELCLALERVPLLSLWQPWATLVAIGAKAVETRPWRTDYRGPVLIHAAKRRPTLADMRVVVDDLATYRRWLEADHLDENADDDRIVQAGPRGAVVAIARLIDVVPTERVTWVPDDALDGMPWGLGAGCAAITEQQRRLGDFTPGRYAWLLDEVHQLPRPVPARGHQGLRPPADGGALARACFEVLA